MGRFSRRWLAILAGSAVLLVIALVATRPPRATPPDTASAPLAKVVLSSTVVVDPAVIPAGFPSSPADQACLDRMTRGSGWLDLCWAGYRLGPDADPAKDYYVLRVYGSHQGLRWIEVTSRLIGTPGDNVYDVWPDGTVDGSCRQEPVNLMVPLYNLAPDDVCGRTEAHLDVTSWAHDLVWTCDGCLFPDASTKGISMYAVVGVPDATVPSWDLFADAGS